MTNHPMRNWQRRWKDDPAARAGILRHWRTTRKMTQRELAGHLCVSRRTVEDWEGGRRTPPTLLMLVLANIKCGEKPL